MYFMYKDISFDKVFYGSANKWQRITFFCWLLILSSYGIKFALAAKWSVLLLIIASFLFLLVNSLFLLVGYKIVFGLNKKGLYTNLTSWIDWKDIERATIKGSCILVTIKKQQLPWTKKMLLWLNFFAVTKVPVVCKQSIGDASLEDILKTIKEYVEKYGK